MINVNDSKVLTHLYNFVEIIMITVEYSCLLDRHLYSPNPTSPHVSKMALGERIAFPLFEAAKC